MVFKRVQVLLEKTSEEASNVWKGFQIVLFGCAAICNLVTAYYYQFLKASYNSECVLYASINFEKPGNDSTLPNIDLVTTVWGNPRNCSYVEIVSLLAFVIGIVWAAMFMTFSRGSNSDQSGLSGPWKIVYLAMFFSCATAVLMIIQIGIFNNGIDVFCRQFTSLTENNTTKCTDIINQYTRDNHHDSTKNIIIDEKPALTYINAVYATILTGLMLWISCLSLLFIRIVMVADFKVYSIIISTKEETLQEIMPPKKGSLTSNDESFSTQSESLISKPEQSPKVNFKGKLSSAHFESDLKYNDNKGAQSIPENEDSRHLVVEPLLHNIIDDSIKKSVHFIPNESQDLLTGDSESTI